MVLVFAGGPFFFTPIRFLGISYSSERAKRITGEIMSTEPSKENNSPESKPVSAEMHPGPGFRVKQDFKRLPGSLIEEFRKFASADISDQQNRLFGIPSNIVHLTDNKYMVGSALTVKLFPGDNLMLHKALDLIQPGDIIVVDAGTSTNAVIGDMVANKAKHRGVTGFLIDGFARDIVGINETGLPLLGRGVSPVGPLHRGPGEVNYPICCGGVVVKPGDIVKVDDCGGVIIPQENAESILEKLKKIADVQEKYAQNVKAGIFSTAWVDEQLNESGCEFS
jgi:regulator of RNase E activity RraA